MHTPNARMALLALLALAAAAGGEARMQGPLQVLSLAFGQQSWEFSSRGQYRLVEDPRGIAQIYHPWEASADGDFASLQTRVEVPAAWTGPLFLNFYAGDTYVAAGWEEVRPRWTHTYAACHQFVGHRFKQVLVDGEVVWERDLGDAEGDGYTSVDLSGPLQPGTSAVLELRVFDRVASTAVLPGDEFYLGIWSWQGQGDARAREKFYARVFWGDVALSERQPLPWEANPARREVELAPVQPRAEGAPARAEQRFVVDAPGLLPAEGFPLSWGIPFARGQLKSEEQVALLGAGDRKVPLQTEVLRRWPDGSIHWLLLDFSALPADREFALQYGSRVRRPPPAPGLVVEEGDAGVVVRTGALSFVVRAQGDVLAGDFLVGGDAQVLGRELAGEVATRDGWEHTRFRAVGERVAVEARGPERASVRIEGSLRAEERVFGRFTCRIHAYRDRPYIRVFFRVFNETDAPAQLVEEMLLRLHTSLEEGEALLGAERLQTQAAETGRLLVRQHRADEYEIFEGSDARRARGRHWEGPILLRSEGGGVAGQVRHFHQQYPKRMWAGMGGQMVFDFFTRTIEYEQYTMTRGEAKRHEVLLHFSAGDEPSLAKVFAAFERPPILLAPEWYARNQAFGLGAALSAERFPALFERMVGSGAPDLECRVPMGLRNWPDHYSDSIYNAYRGTWGNMYQEVDYGAYIVALLAGRRDFFDYAEAYQRHFMDLDICHYHPDPAYAGASYGIAPYHTGSPPYALNAPLSGLFLLYYLTGDRDALEAATGIANWLHAQHVGVGSTSGRAVGWPLRSAVIAYENTGEQKYLDAAGQLVESALGALEPRLHYFSEPPATWQYRGGVPGMNAILAAGLMHYWRATGDERVGRVCADIAYNMAYAWMSPTEPGRILGSDPLQSVYLTGYALQDILPLFWGYELTGDPAFLEKGDQVMRESVLAEAHGGQAFGLSRYWEMQDALYYWDLYRRSSAAR